MHDNRTQTVLLAAIVLCAAQRSHAYVDLAPTIARVMRDAQTISVVEVDKFNRENGAVVLKKIRDLKGQIDSQPIRHQIAAANQTIPRHILEWAEPGRRGVLFVSNKTALMCLGRSWYQVQASAGGWWKLGVERPDLPLTYCGTVSRLADAVELMVAGKTAVITTVPHGADNEAASFDLALNRTALPGLVKLQRMRANLNTMPPMVMGVSNAAWVLGPGTAGEDEIPSLIDKLASSDATVRAESADDLRTLGAKAAAAIGPLAALLDDSAAQVCMSAAAALLRIDGHDERAIETLTKGIESSDPVVRRAAARAAGLAGAKAMPLAGALAKLLGDDDELTRLAALQAIATLGPSAAGAMDAVAKLLDDPQTAADAADALGRMGAAARPAQKRLAELLATDSVPLRWAAVRAMSQIGGEDAMPAVDFMIKELRDSSEVDGYNMMIYVGLLGPVAQKAIPAIQNARIKQPALRPAALWAIEPEKRFPWMGFGGGFGPMQDADVAVFIYEAYVAELGEHLRPAARTLAQKIMDGSAGEVPLWGYKILSRFPEEALPILSPAVSDSDIVKRERAAVALGYMGSTAASAKEQVTAAVRSAPTERERRLIKWCLREIGG